MQILPPSECPSCAGPLEQVNFVLFCRNSNCPAQGSKQIEHFCKTMKIKGLGPSTIEKLELSSIADIYGLSVEYIAAKTGSAKIALKLFEEVCLSRQTPLNKLLAAFGIPLCGTTATEKLAKTVSNIEEIDQASCKKAGLGPAVTANILAWLDNEYVKYKYLGLNFNFEQVQATTKGVVCITGKLKSFPNKQQATEKLKSLGYDVKSTITKDVTILVNESGVASEKTRTAEARGVLIINNLNDLIGDQ